MAGRVVQGYFVGGQVRMMPGVGRAGGPQGQAAARPAPPAPAFASSRIVAQPSGGNRSFEVDPAQLGLARSGGKPLPEALLAKMEAAFRADFSAVRVHVGPQAARIGALAFTTGNDLYFSPGRYQPDSVAGQQLIGHELAHVIQQRQGRVRAPGSGVAVVQDAALEAEADRLGMRAALHRGDAGHQPCCPPSGATGRTILRKALIAAPSRNVLGAGNGPRAIQRASDSWDFGSSSNPMSNAQWFKSGESTFGSGMLIIGQNVIDLGKTKSLKTKTYGAEHAEDVFLRNLYSYIDDCATDARNQIIINISKSPCTSTARADIHGALPVTSNKTVGCTEEWILVAQHGLYNSMGHQVTFQVNMIVQGLYAPSVTGYSQGRVLAASQAALDALRLAGVLVSGDAKPSTRTHRFEAQ